MIHMVRCGAELNIPQWNFDLTTNAARFHIEDAIVWLVRDGEEMKWTHLFPVFPGCGAARSGAALIRDRRRRGARNDPGSAARHFASLHAALRPGNTMLAER